MAMSMLLIVGLIIIFVAPTGLCTFNPDGPETGPVQEVDAQTFLELESRRVDYPVVMPQTPDGWVANSAGPRQIAGEQATSVGFVTAGEGWLQLLQTGAPMDDAAAGLDSDPRRLDRTEQIAGTTVEVYTSDESDVRDIWIADTGEARLLVNGAADDREFSELMEASLNGSPVVAED